MPGEETLKPTQTLRWGVDERDVVRLGDVEFRLKFRRHKGHRATLIITGPLSDLVTITRDGGSPEPDIAVSSPTVQEL